MKKITIFFLLFFCYLNLNAQKIIGTIKNAKGMLLPYASITIKGTSKGVTANNDGRYEFVLKEGTYKIICQHIGYETQEKEVYCKNETIVDFTLKDLNLLMPEVVINPNDENPAYAVIRQAIKKRTVYENQVRSFDCDLYTKDIIKIRSLPDKIMGQKVPDEDRKSMQLDSSGKGIVYLSESISKVYSQLPDKFKMEVLSSRVSGSNSFGFTFPAFINLYKNNVPVIEGPSNTRGYISPIADGALHYYKYKMLGTFEENGKVINSIKVTPRRKFEPLFSGTINIVEGEWSIHSFELLLTKESQLELIDTLKISQLHVPLDNDIYRVKNQVLSFSINFFGIDATGSFLTVYSNYKINPVFSKKLFDKIVIKYDTAVNKKTKEYWNEVRPVPLEIDEKLDYQIKDSLFKLKSDSAFSKNNIDSLRKRQGKVKLEKVFFKGIDRVHYSTNGNYFWGVERIIPQMQYNLAEGFVASFYGYFKKQVGRAKSDLTIRHTVRYGFSNTHLNTWVDFALVRKGYGDCQTEKNKWYVSCGKKVAQYNNENPVDPLSNSISTLLYGKNVMKTFEKYFLAGAFNRRFESGLTVFVKCSYENRWPLYNTTRYTLYAKDSVNITENYPVEKVTIDQIIHHQALIATFNVAFQPGQKYIKLPSSSVSLGSKYPTFSLSYSKGIHNIFGSDVDFDKWNCSIYDDKNLKLLGLFKYKLSVGGFINDKKVYIQDYKHFASNVLVATSAYLNGFQLMKPFASSNIAPLYEEIHLEHHFNGLLTNKIPLIKKWKWNLVGGGNAYYISNKDNYVEYFVGLENIFKILRVDFVSAYQNGKYYRSSFVVGTGGFLRAGFVSNNTGKSAVPNF